MSLNTMHDKSDAKSLIDCQQMPFKLKDVLAEYTEM